MGKLFGTDGVRGVANVSPMTPERVLEIGRAVAYVCKRHSKAIRPKILIGKDTRLSGYMIENALTAGFCSMGVDVLLVGPIPTPGIAYLTHSMRADAGIVLSASHNPFEDNGIKIFGRSGYKLADETEAEIEDMVLQHKIDEIRPTNLNIGRAKRIDDAQGRYIVFCKSSFPDHLTLDGLRIVIDCANGATYKVAPVVFEELGAEVFAIHNQPNGTNINEQCGSQYTQDLAAKVRETRADIGLAFDGDGDRLIVVDDTGKELTGDHIIAICAKFMKEQGTLTDHKVVTTVMSNFGLSIALRELGITQLNSGVGDRYVLEEMRKHGAVLGGEASGHLIFLNHHTTGDGMLAALQLLTVMQETGEKISSLANIMKPTPQKLLNVAVKNKPPLEEVSDVQDAIAKAEKTLGDSGRVLVRYSGTQSLCRVMVEGPDEGQTTKLTMDIVSVVKKALG